MVVTESLLLLLDQVLRAAVVAVAALEVLRVLHPERVEPAAVEMANI
jgi:hypothetical protein